MIAPGCFTISGVSAGASVMGLVLYGQKIVLNPSLHSRVTFFWRLMKDALVIHIYNLSSELFVDVERSSHAFSILWVQRCHIKTALLANCTKCANRAVFFDEVMGYQPWLG